MTSSHTHFAPGYSYIRHSAAASLPSTFSCSPHSLVQLLPPTLTAYYSLSLPLTLHLWHSLIHLVSSPLLSLLSLLLCTRPCSLVGVSFYNILPAESISRVFSPILLLYSLLHFFSPCSLFSNALPIFSSLFSRVYFVRVFFSPSILKF